MAATPQASWWAQRDAARIEARLRRILIRGDTPTAAENAYLKAAALNILNGHLAVNEDAAAQMHVTLLILDLDRGAA